MNSKKVTCRDIEGNQHEVSVEDLQFRPSVYSVTVRDGKVLLARALGQHDFPGGAVDLGESMAEALMREVKEETGVDVQPGRLIYFTANFFIHPISKKPFHTLLFFYTCTYESGEVSTDWFHEIDKQLNAECAEWVPLEEIDKIKYTNPVDSPALIRAAIEGTTLL